MKRTRWALVLTLLAVAAAALAVYALRHGAEGGAEAADTALAVVERRDVEVAAEAAGVVEPIRVIEVKSKASGEVLEVLVETGDRVAQGDLLARIDPRDVQSAVDQAAAELESVRVQRATAEAERTRASRLRDAGLIPDQEYEKTVEVAAAAQAALVRVQTNLRLARERAGDVTIRAPAAGTIIERTVEPGGIIASATSNVSGGTTLFRMADLTEMQVRTKVDEVDIGQIRTGQGAAVTVESYPGRTFDGVVIKVEPLAVVEQNVTLFPVLVHLPNPEGLLRPGMTAEVTLQIANRRGVVAVPNAAVVGLRDAAAAAAAVGLTAEQVQATLRGGGAGRGEASAGRGESDGGRMDGSRGSAASAPANRRAGERSGGRTWGGGAAPVDGMGSAGPAGAGPAGDGGGSAVAARPAVVFVATPAGAEPRRVMLGLSDWEYTEVVSGLEEGEQVVLVSIAQLQQQQQEMADRFRQRAGDMVPGAGGSRSGGSGGSRSGGGSRGGGR